MATETILSICIAGMGLLLTFLAFLRNGRRDSAETASERASMKADVTYIRTSIDEIKLENRTIQKDVGELKTKIVEIEASAKSAHKRLDDMMKGAHEHG